MELVEVMHTPEDMRKAAQLILDQAIIQTNGVGIFEELGFGYFAAGNRMYITDDQSRLCLIVHRLERDGRIYFLGTLVKTNPVE
jgi:hypothetical protein